ncbi:MAG: succinate dehydrogenase assembly factor 2 [Thermoplasmata archaeon]|nr:MAG: succinate dehydrogenase assembly factor 2 [Thermoplasmata archaeon]
MVTSNELEYLRRRAAWLGRRSLLELEVVLNDALENELPERVAQGDIDWLRDLNKILELDDYDLLDALTGKAKLGNDFNPNVLAVLQSYMPGKRREND